MLDVIAICLTITAILAYLNHRFIGLPPTIGVMVIALLLSVALVGLNGLGISRLHTFELALLRSIDFTDVLMQGMLSILLFAGALHVDLRHLRAYRLPIGMLAVLGTTISTALVAVMLWCALPWFGLALPFSYCLLFGALISPTDPIAVMGILKSAKAPASVETVMAGESLFNDGVGVVLFALVTAMIARGAPPSAAQTGMLLLREAGGGIAFGAVLGYLTYRLLSSIDSYQEEVLLTLAAVLGGYSLAAHLHVSAPLAMVVTGLIIGNQGRALAMSDTTREHIDSFWELLDSILNAVLFVLVGLEIVLVPISAQLALGAATAIVATLLARYVSVGLPLSLWRRHLKLAHGTWQILTWGGLRGGISVALALSVPAGAERDILVALTYAVVVFSILAQGGSVGALIRRYVGADK
ncbi:MAG: sodium:proton antiporter [Pseudomonadota bacterium]